MHMAIDIIAGIVLLFFFLSGWHRGALLSMLGIARAVASYSAAYLVGRHLGSWLGAATQRPRIITIPVMAILTFTVIGLLFRIVMNGIRTRHRQKCEKEDFQLPLSSCVVGGTANLLAGTLSLALLFWLGELFLVGVSGNPLPGSGTSRFGRLSRSAVYGICYAILPKQGHETQAAALARVVANPAQGLDLLENILSADSVQQALHDPLLAKDLLSGDAARIRQNASMQRLIHDRRTLEALRSMGLLSGTETEEGLCDKLAGVGRNETIRSSIENLHEKNLLRGGNMALLIRDPDFDAIVAELVK